MRGSNEKPWAGIGVEVNRSLSSREMLYKAKLDWEVSKIPSQRPKSHSNQETFRFYKAYFDAGNISLEQNDLDRLYRSFSSLKKLSAQNDNAQKRYIQLAASINKRAGN